MTYRRFYAAVLLSSLAAVASAQNPPQPGPGPGYPGGPMMQPGAPMMQRGPGGPGAQDGRWQEHMQERMTRRLQHLKETLRITPQQEPAWNSFTAAMRPAPHQRPDFGEMARLTTPQRIDRMRAMRQQRQAEMDRKADATKQFYGSLSPEQQRVFDQISLRMFGRGGHRMGGMHGGMEGGMGGGGMGHHFGR